jgi:Bacterial Ig-like domain (group 2)
MNTRIKHLAAARFCLGLATLLFLSSCSNEHLVSIAVTPPNASVSQTGQTTQFQAIGTTNHPNVQPQVLTSGVAWSSSTPGVATVSSTGLATAVDCGTTTISAQDGGIIGQTTFINTCNGGVLQSITVLPSSPTIPEIGQTTQFVALGTFVAGGEIDLTSTAMWSSSDTQVATVSNTGLATAVSCGATTVSAESQSIVGSTLLTVSCVQIKSIELLVVKGGSVNNTTVISAPAGINCGTLCGALFNEGTGIALTATPVPTSWVGCDQVLPGGSGCFFTLRPDSPGGTQKIVTANF